MPRKGKPSRTSRPERKAKKDKPRDNSLLNPLAPRTAGQKLFLDSIHSKTVTICNGPAGTGKTFISFGSALHYYVGNSPIDRIIIVRPTFKAGDEPELGYLPGGINDKMEPFMAPILRDNAQLLIKKMPHTAIGRPYGSPEASGAHDITAILLKFNIEIVPLHLMRGRTFHKAFVILDEAQNCNMKDFKLFLTRIGEHSKVVIEGDATQADRADGALPELMAKLVGISSVGLVKMDGTDIVRNPIIADIIDKLSS